MSEENKNVSVNAASEVLTTENPKKKRGSNKVKMMLVVAVVVVVVIIAGVTQAAAMVNATAKLFKNPAEYYQYVETKNAEATIDKIGSLYENMIKENLNYSDKSGTTEMSLQLGDDAMALLEMISDEDLEFLENIGFSATSNTKDDAMEMKLGLNLAKKKIVSGEFIADYKSGMAYARVPELTEKYISIELDEILALMDAGLDTDDLNEELDKLKELYEKTPDRKQIEKLLNKYVTLALSCVEDVEEETDVMEADEVSVKCTKLTIEIDDELLQDMMEVVLEAMEDDEELEKLIVDTFTTDDLVDGDDVYDMFKEAVSELLDEVEDIEFGGEELEMCIWVDRNGDICGRSIKFDDDVYEDDSDAIEVFYGVARDGKNIGIELEAKAEDVTVKIGGSGVVKGGKLSGELAIKVAGIKAATIEYKDVKVGKDTFEGSFVLSPSSALNDVLAEELPLDVDDLGLKIDVNTGMKKGSMKVSVLMDDEEFASIAVASELSKGKKVDLPKGKNSLEIEDEDDLLDYLSDMEVDDLLDALEDAGLPDEWIEDMEDFFDYIG